MRGSASGLVNVLFYFSGCADCLIPLIFSADDDSVLWFLRARKFDVDKTVACMKNFVEFRTSVPEWYSERDPLKPEIQELLSIG